MNEFAASASKQFISILEKEKEQTENYISYLKTILIKIRCDRPTFTET
jgi:hypothetical protein